jgi:predicted nucleic acid-binding protein
MPPGVVEFALRRLLRTFPIILPTQRAIRRWLTMCSKQEVRGAAAFDFQIAATCLEHRVGEIWTFDSRFPQLDGLRVVNPLA